MVAGGDGGAEVKDADLGVGGDGGDDVRVGGLEGG